MTVRNLCYSMAVVCAAGVLFISGVQAQERAPLQDILKRIPAMQAEVVEEKQEPSITVIQAQEISKEAPELQLQIMEPVQPSPGGSGGMSLQKPTIPPLDITLTPRDPARFNRAYIQYEYPRSVYINNNHAYAEYSQYNMPGAFKYMIRLEKDKKYLLEIEAATNGGTGDVVHSIGGSKSVHEIASSVTNISRIVQPAEDGWVSGSLLQANTNYPHDWRVFSFSATELE